MAGRDHDAAVEVIHTGDIGHGRGGGDVQQVGVCAGGGQTCDQAVLKHIGAAAGVLANDDTSRLVVVVALPDHIVIPAEEAPHLIGMVSGQSDSSFTTEAIGPKIFSHYLISFSLGFIFTTH